MKKECVQYLKSVTYYIFCICLVLGFFTQMGEFDVPTKPEEGQESYDYVRTTDKDLIMQETLNELWREYSTGSYTTYPIGFYKRIQLDEAEEEKIVQIIINCTGMTEEEFSAFREEENIREAAMEKMLEELRMIRSQMPMQGCFAITWELCLPCYQYFLQSAGCCVTGGHRRSR